MIVTILGEVRTEHYTAIEIGILEMGLFVAVAELKLLYCTLAVDLIKRVRWTAWRSSEARWRQGREYWKQTTKQHTYGDDGGGKAADDEGCISPG